MWDVVQTFDIETIGPCVGQHPLVAIGTTIHGYDKSNKFELLDSLEIHFEFDLTTSDADTLVWWQSSENTEAWQHIQTNPVSLAHGAAQLQEFIDMWQRRAIEEWGRSYTVLVDNAWYDDTWISWLLCHHGGRPLRHTCVPSYDKNGWMRVSHVVDISQRTAALNDVNVSVGFKDFKSTTPHDHTPVNDATVIAEKWFWYRERTRAWRQTNTV